MNKRSIFTISGIILSFVIAIGGWVLAGRLMDMRSNMLMSANGISPIIVPMSVPVLNDTEHDYEYDFHPLLTEAGIVSVLHNINAPGREIPHEPTDEQITMGQAIDIGRTWLSFIREQLYIHQELFVFYDTRAHLSQNVQRDGDGFLSPAYSFWTVTFNGRLIDVTLLINAVEGQVWKTEISLRRFLRQVPADRYVAFSPYMWAPTEVPTEVVVVYFETTVNSVYTMLNEFTAILGIDADNELTAFISVLPHTLYAVEHYSFTVQNTLLVERAFANDEGYAAIRIDGSTSDSERWFIHRFSMYLGVK